MLIFSVINTLRMNENLKLLSIIGIMAIIWLSIQWAKHEYPDHRKVLDMLTIYLGIADFIIVVILLMLQKESVRHLKEYTKTKQGAPFP